ncbi:hypothetical protein OPKNFCMD_6028 [Methylobacterium crusticola]|uniref:Uncharacterized protein n=1 Tax=Methylobacterium crusticola TaxID=1697972 RepID=A0ABQ4R7X2_9HYPH|nr:hypothetical protein OPKNFCMD_6028 [Methylobacterium crusticola]
MRAAGTSVVAGRCGASGRGAARPGGFQAGAPGPGAARKTGSVIIGIRIAYS